MEKILTKIDQALARMRSKGFGDHPSYHNLKIKRDAIANGAKYKVENVAPELVAGMGAMICALNPFWGAKYAGDNALQKGIERGKVLKKDWKLEKEGEDL